MCRPLVCCAMVWWLAASFEARAEDVLPEDAARLVAAFDEDAEALRAEAEAKIAAEKKILAAKLKELQDKYTRAAMLDEAVAIRDKIRALNETALPAQPDPGSMTNFTNRIGEKFYFRVTGDVTGAIWGTDVYTYDSSVSTAAVHTGALKVGETGVVKVTMLPGRESYLAATRNGVSSYQWSAYPSSFKVERVRDPVSPPAGKAPNAATDSVKPVGPKPADAKPVPEKTRPENPAAPTDEKR